MAECRRVKTRLPSKVHVGRGAEAPHYPNAMLDAALKCRTVITATDYNNSEAALIVADLLLSDRFMLFGAPDTEPGGSSRDWRTPPPGLFVFSMTCGRVAFK